MKIVFFGTPDYVLPILKSLHKTFRTKTGDSPITAVVTQRPRPVGRKKILTYSAVDVWAHKRKIPVYYDSTELIKKHIRADLGVLESYGNIIPASVINHFPNGILNAHPSLLPKFRGASPVQATIVAGEKITGVTTIALDQKLDHGPVVSQFKVEILSTDTTDSLRRRLFEKSVEELSTLIPPYLQGKITPRKQDDSKATFTTRIRKQDAFILPNYLNAAFKGSTLKTKWEIPFMKTKDSQALLSPEGQASLIKNYTLTPTPYTLGRFIRAMQPWPIAWTEVKLKVQSEKFKVKRLKILKAHLERPTTNDQRSTVKLTLDEVQLEGKNPVSWKQLIQGYATVMFE